MVEDLVPVYCSDARTCANSKHERPNARPARHTTAQTVVAASALADRGQFAYLVSDDGNDVET